MKIQAKCPRCRKQQEYPPEKAGKRVRCVSCRRIFKIPSIELLSKALKVIDSATATVYVDQDGNIYA